MKNKILIFGAGGLCKQILNDHNIQNDFVVYQDDRIFDEFFKNFQTTNKISDDFSHFILGVSGTKTKKKYEYYHRYPTKVVILCRAGRSLKRYF